MKALKLKIILILLFVASGIGINGQFKTVEDSLDYELHYKKYYDCKYEPGYVLIIQKKGKIIDPAKSWKPTKEGFAIRMEAIYDLEFNDGKLYRSGVIKNITKDSLTISSTMNENCAKYEGIKYELFTYSIKDIVIARFINDRSLGIFSKKKINDAYEVFTMKVDKAKLCPAVLTFPKRNNEVKVCHYYLTDQGYDILFETNGFLDYMQYPVYWQ
ncbi:hypothetical protein SAMN05421856_101262 [Chryseobacterium taichungense]|uniref:Uncharacterized protein n=1 Tax=Chryseobacterium taichungense TaxID=295069 RepID=A0A1H7VUD1_9FLAO|nr:hypothetical protein [Chryseobacterium taichungense]SEM12770.1 hypothetical protein SAMN05421856_101262 [Chryseobacterium taichungense]